MLRQRQARQVLGAMGPQLLVRYQQATTVEHRSTSTCLSSLSNSSTSASSAAAAGAGAWVAFCEVAQILFSRKLKGQEPTNGCALRRCARAARAHGAPRARAGARALVPTTYNSGTPTLGVSRELGCTTLHSVAARNTNAARTARLFRSQDERRLYALAVSC